MRRIVRSSLGVVLLAALGASPPSGEAAESGYTRLGKMPVQDNGRVKPLDTLARQKIKFIYTREGIRSRRSEGAAKPPTGFRKFLAGLRGEDPALEKWEPLAAMIDFQARPQFWDEQEIIAVEYLPLKQALLAIPAHNALADLAHSGVLATADREWVDKAAKDPQVSSADLTRASLLPGVGEKEKKSLAALAHKLSPDQKWLTPDDLEEGEVEVDGKKMAFLQWAAELEDSHRPDRMTGEVPPRTALEKKVEEAAHRLLVFQSLRDVRGNRQANLEIAAFPRPLTQDYLKYSAEAVRKIRASASPETANLSPVEEDALRALSAFSSPLSDVDRYFGKPEQEPGSSPEIDARYVEWLREKSTWVPLRLVLEADIADLTRAGFDQARVLAFRKAYEGLIDAEKAHPNALPESSATAVVGAARDLGESMYVPYLIRKDARHETWKDLKPEAVAAFVAVRDPLAGTSAAPSPEKTAGLIAAGRKLSSTLLAYPPPAEMDREVTFNTSAPFFKAPMAFGLAVVLLLISVGVDAKPHSGLARLDASFYFVGLGAMFTGIMLEVLGFYYRIRITGWAPVTNMYETVIWVGLVTAVLGLILEMIYRKKYSALSASSVSFLCTLLAANVSLLDPDIKSLTPVLRSNYWLTIHVLTIVSSYAAFALAMGLGVLGLAFYLSATYRRDVSYAELAKPLLPGLPLMIGGVIGLLSGYYGGAGSSLGSPAASAAMAGLALVGMMFTIVGGLGLVGEAANRRPSRTMTAGIAGTALGLAGLAVAAATPTPEWWPQTLSTALVPGVVAGLGLMTAILARLGAQARSALIEAEALLETPAPVEPISPGPSFEPIGSVATKVKPTVAQIRARLEATSVKLDPRSQAMQATAARIKPLSNFLYRAMQVGVLLVAAGTILGGVWADVSWGRFWGWDAKEVWALITLLVYLVPLHGRFAGWVNTFGLVAASVFCFASVLMAWYGVNFVLGTGLHTYGFVEGGGQGIVLTCSLAVMAVVLATGRRRKLASIA